jgi:DNA-binding LytR/AlgR family response regulator
MLADMFNGKQYAEETMGDRLIPVFTRREIAAVKENDIVFAESQGRTVIIHTIERDYRYYGKLSALREMLGQSFHTCHSSIVVNFDKVVCVKEGALRMEGGQVVLMGKNAYLATRRSFISFLKKNSVGSV